MRWRTRWEDRFKALRTLPKSYDRSPMAQGFCGRASAHLRVLHKGGARYRFLAKRFESRFGCGGAGLGDRVVILAGASTDADRAHHLPATLDGNAASKNHDLAVVRGMNSKKLLA